jgi:hypothetical protein
MAMKKVSERRSLWSVERDPPANSATATPRTDDLVSEILAIDRRLESPGPSSESAMENGAESVVLVAPTMVAGRALPILANREVSLLDRWRSELRSRPQTILACLGLLAVLLFLWMLHAWAWRRVHHQPWMAMTIWGVASLSLGSLAWVGVVGSIVAIFGLLLEHFSASRPTADRLGTKTQ